MRSMHTTRRCRLFAVFAPLSSVLLFLCCRLSVAVQTSHSGVGVGTIQPDNPDPDPAIGRGAGDAGAEGQRHSVAQQEQQQQRSHVAVQVIEPLEPKLPHPSPSATEAIKKAAPPQAEIIGAWALSHWAASCRCAMLFERSLCRFLLICCCLAARAFECSS